MRSARLATRWWLAAGLVALLGLVPQFLSRTIPDVAFPLWAAGRVLDGARLYVEILEINPPLFIWLDVPLVWLARVTGLDPILVFRLAVTLLLGGSLLAARHLTRRAPLFGSERNRRLFLLTTVFALVVLPRLDWGEREHLSLALVLPWLLMAAVRMEGVAVARSSQLVAGIGAGLGIALKPHFVLLWLAREMVVRGTQGRRGGLGGRGSRLSSLVTPESAIAATLCILYLLATFAFAPDYFPLLRDLAGPYARFIHVTFLESLVGLAPALALASVALAVGLRQVEGARPLRRVLLAGVLAYAVAAVLQSKGFRYHWYPAMALGFLMLAVLVAVARAVKGGPHIRLFRAVAMAGLAVAVVMPAVDSLRQSMTPLAPEWDADPSIGLLLPVLEADGARGEGLAVLSPNMAAGFPLTNYAGTRWPLRFSNLWPAISEYRGALDSGTAVRLHAEGRMTPVETQVMTVTVGDLELMQPERLLVLRQFDSSRAPYTMRVNVRAFLGRDSRFSELLAEYDSLGTVGSYTLWRTRRDVGSGVGSLRQIQWPSRCEPALMKLLRSPVLGAIIFMVALIGAQSIGARAAGRP